MKTTKPKPLSQVEPKGDFADDQSQSFARISTLFGKPVGPFVPRRLMAAQALGLRFFRLTEEERTMLTEAGDKGGVYDGLFWDAQILAFLAQAPVSTLFRTFRVAEAVAKEIMEWGDEHNVCPGSDSFNEVMAFYNQTITDIVKSSAEALPDPKAAAVQGTAEIPGE